MTILTILSVALITHLVFVLIFCINSNFRKVYIPHKSKIWKYIWIPLYISAISFLVYSYFEDTKEMVEYNYNTNEVRTYVINHDTSKPLLISEKELICVKSVMKLGKFNDDFMFNLIIRGAPETSTVELDKCGELPWPKY